MSHTKLSSRIRSFFLAAILSISTIVGPFTAAVSAASPDGLTIGYYSGTETNNGNGNLISTQARDTESPKHDYLKTLEDAIAGQDNSGTTDVVKFLNDGYQFNGWKIGNTIYAAKDEAYKYLNRNNNLTAIAQWIKKSNVKINGDDVTSASTTVKNGTISLSSFPVAQGQDLTITLDPEGIDDNCYLESFIINDVDHKADVKKTIGNTVKYTLPATSITEDVDIAVSFAKKNYSVYTSLKDKIADPFRGTTDPEPLGVLSPKSVKKGDPFALTLKPYEGYQVKSLKLNNEDVTNSIQPIEGKNEFTYTVAEVTEDLDFEVNFESATTHKITITVPEGVTIDTEAEFNVPKWSTPSISINVAEGYRITGVMVDNTPSVILNNKLTLLPVLKDKNIVITAEKIGPLNVITNILGDHGAISEGGEAEYGKTFDIEVTPDAHYYLVNLFLGDSAIDLSPKDVADKVIDGKYTIENITKDVYVTAIFGKITDEYAFNIETTEGVKIITPLKTSKRVGYGDTEIVTFTLEEGYELKSIKINGKNIDALEFGLIAEVANNLGAAIVTVPSIEGDTTIEISAKIKAYNIAATSTNILRGIVTPVLKLNAKYGEKYTLNITPYPGYELDKLTFNGKDITNKVRDNVYETTINKHSDIQEDGVFLASFKPKTYTITVTAPENVTVDPAGPITAEYLDTKTINITPNDGNHITSISINGKKLNALELAAVKLTNKLTLPLISEDKNIIIESKKNTYDVRTNVLGGHGTITKGSKVEHGGNYTIELSPNTGYELSSLTINGKNVTDDVKDNSYTIENITSDVLIVATYKRIEYPVTTEVLAGKGTITKSTNVKYGDDLLIRVTPDKNYVVDTFTVDGKPAKLTSGYYLLRNVTEGHEVKVAFKLVERKLTVHGAIGATVSPVGTQKVDHGTTKDITIKAKHNYAITGVLVNGRPQRLPLTDDTLHLTVTEDTTVRVFTKKVSHDVITKVHGGHGAVSDSGNVKDGESFTVTATPDDGYKVNAIYVNGRKVKLENNSYTIKSVKRDTFVVVTFDEYFPSITFSATEGVKVESTVPEQVKYGEDLKIKLTSESGYYLSSIKVNGKEIELPLDQDTLIIENITEDTTIEVSAEKKTYRITSLNPSIYNSDINDTLTVASDGERDEFAEVLVDGQVVNKDFYTVSGDDTTIITFNHDFMASLGAGNHTVRLVYGNGNYAETTFLVEKTAPAPISAPNSGQNTKISEGSLNLSLLASIIVATMIGAIFLIRKTKTN